MLSKKNQIALAFAKMCKRLNKYPTMNEFNDNTTYTKDMVAHHHGSLGRLKEYSRKRYPKQFKNVLDDLIFNKKAIKSLKKRIKGANRFVITTAVTGCRVHDGFLESIKNYCGVNKAEILVLLASDPAANVDQEFLDPKLDKDWVVISDQSLNSNIHLNTIKLSAKHIDPITSLTRIGQRNGSFLYASPKQRLKYIATGNQRSTYAVMTTGAITSPDYRTEKYMSGRTAHIAEHDHVMGAIIVEIEDDKKYHFRQVQADSEGSFIDLGKQYFPDRVEDCAPAAMVWGDLHVGDTDPVVRDCWVEISKLLKPQKIVLHDAFNAQAINHHEDHDIILKAQRAEAGQLDLKTEVTMLTDELNVISKLADEIVIVKSNHDEFLERYLREARYAKDPHNHRLSLELASQLLDGKDPLKHAVEKFKLKNPSKFRWLKRDDDFIIGRVQLGAHGDMGGNGSRGNIRSLENAYGNSVTGHSHTPEILRGAWVVGTSSYLKLSYNKGPSSWMHTLCLVYANGSRQLINVIDGKWRLV